MFSAGMLILMLLGALVWQVQKGDWLRYGVDFTGGTQIRLAIAGQNSVGDLRPIIDPLYPGADIRSLGDTERGHEYMIRTQQVGDATSGAADQIPRALAERFGEEAITVESADAVGAKVGSELQIRAIIAILVSFAATLIYLAFRFEWRFGAAAVIATVHDILLTLGLISLLQLEVALPMVAAVLTIVGYSLNDTIVIFDRIRENLAGPLRREGFENVLNKSINDTLPRTVLTSSTTLVTLMSLYLFGGVVIREFALILIVGVLLGTYSSIFVASPALLEIEKRWPAERKKARLARARA
jgi:preprotein translocase subunit SecF